FNTFGSAGIEVIDSDQKYLRDDKAIDRTAEGAEELELDLTPGALDKTNDPVRMYLREMGTVPLLTREGEVEIARRIERGKHDVAGQAEVPPVPVGGHARAGRALAAHPRDRVHRSREAAPDRRDEGCGRGRQGGAARDRGPRAPNQPEEQEGARQGRGPQEHS